MEASLSTNSLSYLPSFVNHLMDALDLAAGGVFVALDEIVHVVLEVLQRELLAVQKHLRGSMNVC